MTDRTLTIDPEFEGYHRGLTAEEFNLLEMSLLAEGCRDAIVVWANHDDTILDGHNRYRLCQQNEIPFKTKALKLDSRDAATKWIVDTQLGRRNNTEAEKSYLRGKRYNAEKKQGERTDLTCGQDVHKLKTAEKLATEYAVDEKTIRRDADYAEAVDTIDKALGPKAKTAILTGKANKADVVAVAELTKKDQRQAVQAMTDGDKAALKKLLGKTPQEEANEDPERRWLASLHKLYVFMTSTRDHGGIKRLVRKWTADGRAKYADELKRIVGELTKWIEVLESK